MDEILAWMFTLFATVCAVIGTAILIWTFWTSTWWPLLGEVISTVEGATAVAFIGGLVVIIATYASRRDHVRSS